MKERVSQALNLGRLSYGPLSQEFETRFAQMHGCKYGVLSNSGTSSLLVALQTLKELHGWHDGDIVLVPALTFVASVNVILQLRLKPVLVDIDSVYYDIDTDKLSEAIPVLKRWAKCILPVHVFGHPCMMDTLSRIAYFNDLKIVEDSCEAMLVKRYDSPVGSYGDIACFSTYIAHLLVTGVGGLSTTNNPEYAQYQRSLVNHGIDLSELPTGEQYDTTWFNRKFSFNKVGHSFRLTELEAAIGLAQLDDLADIIKHRQSNAAYLSAGLADLEDKLQLPKVRPNTESAFMMYCLVCLQDDVRDNLMRYLNENGIGTRLALPLIRQPVYKGLWNPEDYPIADWMDRQAFYVGSHQGLSVDDLDYMINTIQDFYASR